MEEIHPRKLTWIPKTGTISIGNASEATIDFRRHVGNGPFDDVFPIENGDIPLPF